ncbi:hypothetical protein PNEG_02815 [Pneumocystis murina B123]|uniref:Cell division control protein 45 n=1 Tax=Pneumocystis murina (strain B123) TaxID=1069680 RepID=M7NK84_PNEMU|nr:hypothetical protein PNEG_02815 [Pneumocystis murina B123]EMR09043.1 hypothetical protein PNEG_02815 [Pneumocystis murina B123]
MFIRRSNYVDAYSRIKAASLSGSCTVLIFVALEVDALCACKMLSTIMKHDFISHKIQPVSGYQDIMDINQTVVLNNENLRFLILLNCGALIDLSQYLTPQDYVTIYVIDSHRPWNLDNAFSDNNIFVFDDGDIEEKLSEERRAYEALAEASDSELERDDDYDDSISDEKDFFFEDENFEKSKLEKQNTLVSNNNLEDLVSSGDAKNKEVSSDPAQLSLDCPAKHDSRSAKRKQYYKYQRIISNYYDSGTWFGECISSQVYSLASDIGREDNELLWLAIIGLTSQEIHRRTSYNKYLQLYSLFKDEVNRLNPPVLDTKNIKRANGRTADDSSIKARDEFRFMLVRHWSLYDAMLHSSYLGAKLKIWSEYGKKKLHKLFAKMGISLQQCRQIYTHMDIDLKKNLQEKLDRFAPLYGLNDLIYPSFIRTFGFKCTLSASDASYGLSALLETGKHKCEKYDPNKENERPLKNIEHGNKQEDMVRDLWLTYFYDAFDALDNIDALYSSLSVAMELQRAIVRTGTYLIDKRAIRHLKAFRIAVLKEGPDLGIFTHPFALSKLAIWVADAINEQEREQGRTRHLPFVIASLNERTDTYLLLGTSVSTSSDELEDNASYNRNRFGLIFSQVAQATSARLKMDAFDAYCVEVYKQDLANFLEILSTKIMF